MSMLIKLINMPFATLNAPSMGLTQLRSVTQNAHAPRVTIDIHYLNHEFGRRLGYSLYGWLAVGATSQATNLGEWLFRQAAFPDLADNKVEYLRHYAPHFDKERILRESNLMDGFREKLNDVLDDLIDRYSIADADVVGLTSMFSQNLPCIALATRLRRIRTDQIIVMGGANCEGPMGIELVCNLPMIDFVFSGRALVSFPDFIGCLLRGDYEACHRIDGVFSKRNARSITSVCDTTEGVDWGRMKASGQLIGVEELGKGLDINVEIALDYDEFLESFDRHFPQENVKPLLMFETSRGCWWGERAHCTFCGLNGSTMAYKAMRPELALKIIKSLISRYDGRIDILQSVDNILPKEYIHEVFAKLSVPDGLSFFYEVKADLSAEQLRILAGGGVRVVQPGIESLATSTLKLMRKGATAFGNIRFLSDCKDCQIEPVWNVLIGFPGETEHVYETYARIFPHLHHLPPPSGVFSVRFDRFSPYFVRQNDYGLRLAPFKHYSLCYPFTTPVLMRMAYYFDDLNVEAAYRRDSRKWAMRLSELVDTWRSRWLKAIAPPKLEIVGNESRAYIVDSRASSLPKGQLLSPAETSLLRAAKTPVLLNDLSPDSREAVSRVAQNGYVFVERDRIMSIASGF